ncbi:MAG: glycosyltransferase [Nitrospirae bacterium]|nr:glycosyltransferase [Nitrospirota bacterium]
MKSKAEKTGHFNSIAPQKDYWRKKNSYYYKELEKLLASLVPVNCRIIEVGCGTGDTLAHMKPSYGKGIDFSPEMIRLATGKYPNLDFAVDDIEDLKTQEPFDYVVCSDLIGELTDVWKAFRDMRKLCHRNSRLVVTYYNYLWEPVLRLAERLGLKMPQDYQNWLSLADIENLLYLNGFETIKKGHSVLLPKYIPVLSGLCNRMLVKLPLLKKLGLVEYIVAKPAKGFRKLAGEKGYSVSVIVPCRNEVGNIEDAVARIPHMGSHTEIIFVDGNSTDGTVEKIEEMIKRYNGIKDIKLIHQIPKDTRDKESAADLKQAPNKMLRLGKGDAVRKGFDAAAGEVLMILDSDLTVPPEDLPKFYEAIAEGKGDLINGTRLVYQMEDEAMRILNIAGNKVFSMIFTWLLDQPIKDTLCGTKVLTKENYLRIREHRNYFGDFDPFGDFDLLFGAARQNLKIVEIPIRYRARKYGNIKIERFRHGVILLKMSWLAFKKLKLS